MSPGFSTEYRGSRQVVSLHRVASARVWGTLSVLALQTLAAQPFTFAALPLQQAPDGGSSARVRVKLDGFDLSHAGRSPNQAGTGSHERSKSMPGGDAAPAPRPPLSMPMSRAPNQVGGASRSLGPAVYAPQSAKAYTLTPTFYWRAEDPQSIYTFTLSSGPIAASGPSARYILYSGKVIGSRFTYPSTAPALTPGESYTWTLASKDDGATKASITIVGGTERDALTEQIRSTGGPGSIAEAKILFDARVWYDALDDYTRLIERAPAPEFYRRRSALYDQLPDTDALADADFAKAAK